MQIPSIFLTCIDLYCSSLISNSLVRFMCGDKEDISVFKSEIILAGFPDRIYPAIEETEDLDPYRPLI